MRWKSGENRGGEPGFTFGKHYHSPWRVKRWRMSETYFIFFLYLKLRMALLIFGPEIKMLRGDNLLFSAFPLIIKVVLRKNWAILTGVYEHNNVRA